MRATFSRALAVCAAAAMLGSGTVAAAGPASAAAVVCTTHQGNTVGWIDCSGKGTARIVIDCKAPQITDYYGEWITFTGYITQSGECWHGINYVSYQVR